MIEAIYHYDECDSSTEERRYLYDPLPLSAAPNNPQKPVTKAQCLAQNQQAHDQVANEVAHNAKAALAPLTGGGALLGAAIGCGGAAGATIETGPGAVLACVAGGAKGALIGATVGASLDAFYLAVSNTANNLALKALNSNCSDLP
jgi:hypothetical protein